MLNFNGNTPKTVLFNGYNVATLMFNGVKAWVSKVLTTLTGYPLTLSNSTGDDLEDYTVYGNSTQDGTPTPDTPIDVVSVGDLVEDETDGNYGKYKIPIVTRGKNLFSVDYYVKNKVSISNQTQVDRCVFTVKPNTAYIVSTNTGIEGLANVFVMSGGNTNTTMGSSIHGAYTDNPRIVNADSNGYILVGVRNSKLEALINGEFIIQIEEGSTATEYEPYTENTANIYLDEPLRKVGDYTDYVNFAEGKVVRNVLNFVPSGNDGWNYATSNARFTLSNTTFGNVGANGRTPILSNRFVFGLGSANYTALRYTSVIIIYYTEFTSADELNAYFAENPTYFLVALGKPTEEEIELPSVATTEGVCYVSIDTSVAPSDMSVAYYAG
jgi:hypothetical protein